MRFPSIYIIGAGGHGKAAIRAAQAGGVDVAGVFDDNPAVHGHLICGAPVLGSIASIKAARAMPALIAIGDNRQRWLLAEELDLPWATVIHPAAYVDRRELVGQGSLVLAGAVVQVDAWVGDHAIVNNNATIEHDCRTGAGAHIASGACLSGGAAVGQRAFIGAGAVVLPNIHVGCQATIGAGAVVLHNIPDGATAVGVPARVICGPPAMDELPAHDAPRRRIA